VSKGGFVHAREGGAARKLRGGYYTSLPLAVFLLRWIAGIRPRRLLEPSCGDGAFFRPLLGPARIDSLQELIGIERDPTEAARAAALFERVEGLRARIVGEVVNEDFLAWLLPRLADPPEFDAVVGNPPFVRYQLLDEAFQRRAQDLFRHLGLGSTRYVNAWVPFVVGALSRLRPGGRLAMVVPGELLHVLHAAPLRQALLAGCSRVLLLDPGRLVFDDALQGVLLLLAEKGRGPAGLALRRLDESTLLSGSPEAIFESSDYLPGERLPDKWMRALLTGPERDLLDAITRRVDIVRFDEVARVRVGIVTGANAFFLVSEALVRQEGLGAWARPMFGRSEHVVGVLHDEARHEENRVRGLPTCFLDFPPLPLSALDEAAARYIRAGEARGLHRRFKCRIREPWYTVPSVTSAPVALLKRCHDLPRLALNRLGALTTDTAYRVEPRATPAASLVAAFVNSLTALSAELEGRHYAGGVLELVPSEIRRLWLPRPEAVPGSLERLDELYRAGGPAERILEAQDAGWLGRIGLSEADQACLRSAWARLRDRRRRASSSPRDGLPT
jgi:adenine-specific DNA methylase